MGARVQLYACILGRGNGKETARREQVGWAILLCLYIAFSSEGDFLHVRIIEQD
jgi:hypothetical protein